MVFIKLNPYTLEQKISSQVYQISAQNLILQGCCNFLINPKLQNIQIQKNKIQKINENSQFNINLYIYQSAKQYPCDDGYYGNREFLECKPCYSSCATCLDQSQICTSCITMLFLKGSTCLTTCGKNFKNFMNWICESECSSGYTIKDNINNIYVCVEECGQLYATYLYKWNQQCYENIPNINVFCLNYECEDCHSSCQQCQGPTSNDCLVCNQDSYLLNNQCVIDCQMFKYDQKNWKCVEECPIESLQSSGISLLLNKSIIVCGLTCKFETFQFRNQCYDQQPDETFCIFRTDYYFCELCSSLCTKCSSTSSTDCQECIPTAFQYGIVSL